MFKFSGYPEAGATFAQYVTANYHPIKAQVNKTVIVHSLLHFFNIAAGEELTPTEASKINQFKAIAYIFADGSVITA
jgi:uncharacterized SAM-dependent methyltransferase